MSKQNESSKQGPLDPTQRWSARRKREVALRLLSGEPLEAVSRETGVEIYRLEQWREAALVLKPGRRDNLVAELRLHLGNIGLVFQCVGCSRSA